MAVDAHGKFAGRRIGLVLCGGGFKGGYQIGAWKALRERGLSDFRYIAGTSVGALNSVLIANGDLEDAEKLWRDIDIMKWQPRGIVRYLVAYSLLFGPMLVGTLTSLAWIPVVLSCGSGVPASLCLSVGVFMSIATLFQALVARLASLEGNPFFVMDPIEYALKCLLSTMVPLFAIGVVMVTLAITVRLRGQPAPHAVNSAPSFWSVMFFGGGGTVFGIVSAVLGIVMLKQLQVDGQLFSSDGLTTALATRAPEDVVVEPRVVRLHAEAAAAERDDLSHADPVYI